MSSVSVRFETTETTTLCYFIRLKGISFTLGSLNDVKNLP